MNDYSPIVTTNGRKLCGIESCGRPHRVRGLCLAHGQRVRVHGDPQADKPLRSHTSRPWKGDDVSYVGAHNRVTREHGKAAEWKCACGCGRQATDWAYLGTDPAVKVDETGCLYSVSPDHYAPLAKSCHRKFDAWQAQRRPGVSLGAAIIEAMAA
ncbi:hypothetical protein ACFYPK_07970 [Streptomyces halstedii]|uniref:hypothetical protein n=1 Tax=Streptomyces TaxID=1883 RepID=UPI0004A8C63A|nr:hypothetical protein [Streptomyces sp. NTK 937]KDQ67243.1 hypothetical protein DT87_08400 [Streptomyces sp. NTK 937]